MHCTRKISDNIYWIGGNDRRLSKFENLFPIPEGVSYNSYAILDEKTAVLDTADHSIDTQFIENLEYVLDGKQLDYLVINHMEPDHCASIYQLFTKYQNLKLVGNSKTFSFLNQFFKCDLTDRTIIVAENDTLTLGKHILNFTMAPMVHWPEVMMCFEETEGILFSADAFGTFGTLDGTIFNDEITFDSTWLDSARRYYTNIVGKYGTQVQSVLKKAKALPIKTICPLHGPIWRNDLEFILDKYDLWSRYEPEENGVLIAYASMYGNTENVANILAARLADNDITNIIVKDVSVTDVSYLIAAAFKYSHIVLACPTYNGGIFPAMEHFVLDMKALNLQNRTFAIIENGTWGPTTAKQLTQIIETFKNITILDDKLSIKSSAKLEDFDKIDDLALQIKSLL